MIRSTGLAVAAVVLFVGFIVFIYRLARRQLLTFRYAVGWFVLFGVGVFATALLPLTVWIAERFRVTPSALIAAGGLTVLLLICIQLSISISALQNQIRQLTEKLAELQFHVRERDRGT